MNTVLSQLVLTVTRGDTLSNEEWRAIVREALADLSQHIGECFDLDPDPSFFDKGFSMWIFGEEGSAVAKPTAWSGVLSGRVIDPDWFSIEFSQFLFDRSTRRRIRGAHGTYLSCVFSIREGEPPVWRSLGWTPDEYDEWEDVPFPELPVESSGPPK